MTGERLKEILQENDISGYHLATLMKLHPRSIYGYYGKKIVKTRILERIIKATGLDRRVFFPAEKNAEKF